MNGDNEDHDEDGEIIDMKLKKEALITESKIFLESGRLEEEKLLVWNRLPGFNFVLVFFLNLNHCYFLSFVTALLENDP